MTWAYHLKGSVGMIELKAIGERLGKIKYPLLILIIGVAMMLIPSGGKSGKDSQDRNALAAEMLECTEGVGKTKVLISDNGVIVACTGADKAAVKMNIIKAINSYTGFSSDKITILKMTE